MRESHPGRPIGEESDDDLPLRSSREARADVGDPGDGPSPSRKPVTEFKKPSTVGGIVYLVVLVAALAGVVVAATGPWRTGVSWLGVSLLAGAGARLLLPTEVAGMLEVRRKSLDVSILVVFGVCLIILATTIPDQPV
ncbi:DUF3017 domain-containing protein [Nocardioides alcanivorans]|uniref:DUF3017 domain-containing protein n=1 Tax=Nocardioides alcanivorans TaxID=2897352 RepID=UPI001F15D2EE|nr:DUF3017 domain-containing protein [Nocardioides alcanivorans]